MSVTASTVLAADAGAIRDVLRRYHAAMVDARLPDLDTLLVRDFTLVHITGFVQSKREWFDVIESRACDYHRVTIDDHSVAVSVADADAVVAGRGIFDATIHGLQRPWRLRFTMQFAKSARAWRERRAHYDTV